MCLILVVASFASAQLPVSQSEVYINKDNTEVHYGINHRPELGGPPSFVSVNRNPLVVPEIRPEVAPYAGILSNDPYLGTPFYSRRPAVAFPFGMNYVGLPIGQFVPAILI